MFGNLTAYDNDLFDPFDLMRREFGQLFEDRSGPRGIRSVMAGSYPAINVGAAPEQVDVYVFAAGLNPKSMEISLQQNLLTVSGERELEPHGDAHYYRKERRGGAFRRVITLPEDVDPDRVTANYRDGVLRITVARREAVQPKRIEVK
tara:strand:+ start:8257 stop:8700 length:444 start_codon:yes stop_codon:yes gene_type:complete